MAGASESSVINDLLKEEKLVELWPDYPCLFNVASADFKNRDKREMAYSEIAEKVETNADWVRATLRKLRNSYTKAKKPKPSGAQRKSPSKRTTWLIEKLQFLDPYVAARPTSSNLDQVSEEEDDDKENSTDTTVVSGVEETSTPAEDKIKKPIKATSKSKRKKVEEEELELIKVLTRSINESSSQANSNKIMKKSPDQELCDTFGSFVSQSLLNLDTVTRNIAQHKISEVLFQAQMGMLGLTNPMFPVPASSMQTQPLQQQAMQFLAPAPKQPLSEWQVPAPQ